jgi:hypothetical protein
MMIMENNLRMGNVVAPPFIPVIIRHILYILLYASKK